MHYPREPLKHPLFFGIATRDAHTKTFPRCAGFVCLCIKNCTPGAELNSAPPAKSAHKNAQNCPKTCEKRSDTHKKAHGAQPKRGANGYKILGTGTSISTCPQKKVALALLRALARAPRCRGVVPLHFSFKKIVFQAKHNSTLYCHAY